MLCEVLDTAFILHTGCADAWYLLTRGWILLAFKDKRIHKNVTARISPNGQAHPTVLDSHPLMSRTKAAALSFIMEYFIRSAVNMCHPFGLPEQGARILCRSKSVPSG